MLTLPDLVERCFHAAGVEMGDLLTLVPVDPMYRAVYADGSEVRVRQGREAMADEVRRVCGPGEAAAFERFCDWLGRLYRVEMPHFIETNYDGPLDLVRPLGPALDLVRMGAFGRLGRAVARRFADERLRRIFSFQALYAGLAPYEALALYAVITYMDVVNGVVAGPGGMHALPQALAAAAAKAGARLRYGAPVGRILLAEGATGPVQGVRLAGGEVVRADAVVCNADLPVAYPHLAARPAAARAVRRGRYSPSAVVWHVGVRGAALRGRPPQHPLRPSVGGCLPLPAARRAPHARPVVAGQRAIGGGAVAGPRGRARALRARAGAQPRRADRLDHRAGTGPRRPRRRRRRVRLPVRHRGRGGGRPARLGGSRHGARHPVRPRPHVLSDGPVPAGERAPRRSGAGVHRVGHRPGVGIPMVLVSGMLAARRVHEALAR